MYKWSQVNCLTKIIQEIIAKYKLPDIKYKLPDQVYQHELKPSTWNQVHSQITFKSNPKTKPKVCSLDIVQSCN